MYCTIQYNTVHIVLYNCIGTCVSSWATYQCLCPEGNSGRDCSIQTEPSYTLYGLGYLRYNSDFGVIRKPWYNSFVFKTTVDNRLLLRVDLQQGQSVEYKVGSLQYQ